MMKCWACNGQKKLLSLGNIKKDCPACGGVGYLDDLTKRSEPATMDLPKPRKKPGRKPKAETVLHV